MEISWSILLILSCVAASGNAHIGDHDHISCFHCVTMTEGQKHLADVSVAPDTLRTALSIALYDEQDTTIPVPGNCSEANYGVSIECPAESTGCSTERFTLNMSRPNLGNFRLSAVRRSCSVERSGCQTGSEYFVDSLFSSPTELILAVRETLMDPDIVFNHLIEGSYCTCDGSLCNGDNGKDTFGGDRRGNRPGNGSTVGCKTSYAVLLIATLFASTLTKFWN